jgi:hypothetical protein
MRLIKQTYVHFPVYLQKWKISFIYSKELNIERCVSDQTFILLNKTGKELMMDGEWGERS